MMGSFLGLQGVCFREVLCNQTHRSVVFLCSLVSTTITPSGHNKRLPLLLPSATVTMLLVKLDKRVPQVGSFLTLHRDSAHTLMIR